MFTSKREGLGQKEVYVEAMTVNFGYLKDRKITDVLVEKPFTLSAEMIPPRMVSL
jgi:hypothetical protein